MPSHIFFTLTVWFHSSSRLVLLLLCFQMDLNFKLRILVSLSLSQLVYFCTATFIASITSDLLDTLSAQSICLLLISWTIQNCTIQPSTPPWPTRTHSPTHSPTHSHTHSLCPKQTSKGRQVTRENTNARILWDLFEWKQQIFHMLHRQSHDRQQRELWMRYSSIQADRGSDGKGQGQGVIGGLSIGGHWSIDRMCVP